MMSGLYSGVLLKSSLLGLAVSGLLILISTLSEMAVKPTSMSGPMNFDLHIPIAICGSALISLVLFDVLGDFLPLSKIFLGAFISLSIAVPLHLQLIQIPYDCGGVGCGEDWQAPAGPLQYLLLFWLALWFFLCPIFEWLLGRSPFRKHLHGRARILYSLCIAAIISLVAFILSWFSSEELLLLQMPMAISFYVLLAVIPLDQKSGYGLTALYLLLSIFINFIGIYLVSLQDKYRWLFTIALSIVWVAFGDIILRGLYGLE